MSKEKKDMSLPGSGDMVVMISPFGEEMECFPFSVSYLESFGWKVKKEIKPEDIKNADNGKV